MLPVRPALAPRMTLFGIGEAEAIRRINRHWQGQQLLEVPPPPPGLVAEAGSTNGGELVDHQLRRVAQSVRWRWDDVQPEERGFVNGQMVTESVSKRSSWTITADRGFARVVGPAGDGPDLASLVRPGRNRIDPTSMEAQTAPFPYPLPPWPSTDRSGSSGTVRTDGDSWQVVVRGPVRR